MALVACWECGQQTSDTAMACPACGALQTGGTPQVVSTELAKATSTGAQKARAAGNGVVSEVLQRVPLEQMQKDAGLREIVQLIGSGTRSALKLAVRPLQTLAMVSGAVWDRFDENLARRLADTPSDELVEPSPRVTMAILQAVPDAHTNPDLIEMLTALLAAAMKSDTAALVNEHLIELVSAMSPGDALVFNFLAEVPVVCGTGRTVLIISRDWEGVQRRCTVHEMDGDREFKVVDTRLIERESTSVSQELFVLSLERLRSIGLVAHESKQDGYYGIPEEGGWRSYAARRFPLTPFGLALSVALGKGTGAHLNYQSIEVR